MISSTRWTGCACGTPAAPLHHARPDAAGLPIRNRSGMFFGNRFQKRRLSRRPIRRWMMDSPPPLIICDQSDPHVLHVTVSRPAQRNALSNALIIELADTLTAAAGNDDIRCG